MTKITKKGKAIRVGYEVTPNVRSKAPVDAASAKDAAAAKGGSKKEGKGGKGQKGAAA